MKNADVRIAFAIRFSQMDLAHLRPGDWLNLRDDVATFLRRPGVRGDHAAPPEDLGGIVATPVGGPSLADYTEKDFAELQKHTMELLAHVTAPTAQAPGVKAGPDKTVLIKGPDKAVPIAGQCFLQCERKQNYLLFYGPVRDCFLVTLLFLLAREPGDRIRRCPAPACGALFLRIRKQEYCSRTFTP